MRGKTSSNTKERREPMNKVRKIFAAVFYSAGAAIVCLLAAAAILRPHAVLFPDAMLPAQLYELVSVWLACGFLPMLIASALFYRVYGISQGGHRIRSAVLLWLPAGLCLLCLLFWAGVWGLGMVNMAVHGMG